jgi:hypothetical protein
MNPKHENSCCCGIELNGSAWRAFLSRAIITWLSKRLHIILNSWHHRLKSCCYVIIVVKNVLLNLAEATVILVQIKNIFSTAAADWIIFCD